VLRRTLIHFLTIVAAISLAGCAGHPDTRPKVLIIGDSISLGYTPYVKQLLASDAELVHSEGNSEDSNNGVRNVENWIGSKKWDVISFNFGLWDLCYRMPGPITFQNRNKVDGTIAVPLAQYEQNLSRVAARLKATGAKVIFQNTTFVPNNEPGRYAADVSRYNQVAAAVMKRYDIPVNDLSAVSAKLPAQMYESDTDVHYTEPGYAELAKSVAASIRSAL
jgi:hypothetical protein